MKKTSEQAETAEPSAGKELITNEHWQRVGDLIESALHGYRCQKWQTEEDGGMPLADLLTPAGESLIAFGKAELELLSDHILIELHSGLATPSEAMRRDAARWWPIETAPKDGTELLLVDDEGIRVVGRWSKHNHVPMYGWIRQVELYGEEVDGFNAVAWMRLPAPPSVVNREMTTAAPPKIR